MPLHRAGFQCLVFEKDIVHISHHIDFVPIQEKAGKQIRMILASCGRLKPQGKKSFCPVGSCYFSVLPCSA